MTPVKVDFGVSFGGQPAASDVASTTAVCDPEARDVFVSSFCGRIYVRASDAAGAKECTKGDAAREDFEVSSSAEACLAPNMLVLSEDGPFAHHFQLQFPKQGANGAFIATAPAPVKSSDSHVMRPYNHPSAMCPRCGMYVFLYPCSSVLNRISLQL